MAAKASQETLFPCFGDSFLDDHAGRIISDPYIAIVELVANCWDAGASVVNITWPEGINGLFQIIDDGTGMKREEFTGIWRELSYDRVHKQGPTVKFPDTSISTRRTAYGRNGKGRHSLFCFSDEYLVETWKEGNSSVFRVQKSFGQAPYLIEFMKEEPKEGHGTKIQCNLMRNYLTASDAQDLLGSKFSTDPSFSVFINQHKIELVDLKNAEHEEFQIPGEGTVEIITLDSKKSGRTSKQHGVAWWVNNRLVGEHSWKGFEGTYLDGRTSEAKRFTIIVIADFLINEVKPDWTSFKNTTHAKEIILKINEHILQSIQKVMHESRHEIKLDILSKHKSEIRLLSDLSKDHIGQFVNEIQIKCPTMTPDHLSSTVGILAKMESSRTGYDLLHQLDKLSPSDLDSLSSILDQWSLFEAKEVLNELYKRLEIIKRMEELVENPDTSELQELQPLFEAGLWIFGPEYEGIQYLSNKALTTVVRKFLGGGEIENPRRRPDLIAFSDRTLGVYAKDDFDARGEVCGFKKILIIELKKGGFTIGSTERQQADDYAMALYNSGKLSPKTQIMCYVLGAQVKVPGYKLTDLPIEIITEPYNTVIQRAHARTFYLIRKIKESRNLEDLKDKEMIEVLAQQEITSW